MRPNQRRFIFSAINPRWRLVAKELIAAMLAPRHEAVALLPRAYRVPVHLGTAFGRLAELTRWLNWLTARGVTSLGEVDDECCQAPSGRHGNTTPPVSDTVLQPLPAPGVGGGEPGAGREAEPDPAAGTSRPAADVPRACDP